MSARVGQAFKLALEMEAAERAELAERRIVGLQAHTDRFRGEGIDVLAVMHPRRPPGHWSGRLQNRK